jgi:hypothetical protein
MKKFRAAALAATTAASDARDSIAARLPLDALRGACEAQEARMRASLASLGRLGPDLADLLRDPTPEKLMARPDLLPAVLNLMTAVRHPGRAAMRAVVGEAARQANGSEAAVEARGKVCVVSGLCLRLARGKKIGFRCREGARKLVPPTTVEICPSHPNSPLYINKRHSNSPI